MKNILITGANSGVGLAATKFFASKGHNLICISKNDSNLSKINSDNFEYFKVDISNLTTLKNVFSKINKIDVLINCAAIFESKPFIDQSFEMIGKIIDINLKGTLFVSRLCLEKMSKGRIINISSVSGLHGIENQVVYSSTKHALNGFEESLNKELISKGIQVTNVNPGGIKTSLWNKKNPYNGDIDRLLKPSDIVNILNFIVESESRMVIKNISVFPDNEIH